VELVGNRPGRIGCSSAAVKKRVAASFFADASCGGMFSRFIKNRKTGRLLIKTSFTPGKPSQSNPVRVSASRLENAIGLMFFRTIGELHENVNPKVPKAHFLSSRM